MSDFVIKAVIDTGQPATPCRSKEVEDENDDEDADDWGSRELRPTISGIVCLKAIDQSGQHCYNTRQHFLKTVRK
jgi:hypothetical protein